MLADRGVMSPSELAQHFDVSVMTIHRDLNELQRRGIILKSHGGVTPQPAGTFAPLPLRRRRKTSISCSNSARSTTSLPAWGIPRPIMAPR